MPANRRKVAVKAPYDRWVLLGKLLAGRRRELGYTYRAPGFERDSGVNRRMSADLETAAAKRVDHFTEGSLRLAAHGYQVTYGSLIAVLDGKADELTPALPADPPGWTAPTDDAARAAANRPWFDEINERRFALAAQGVTVPSGAQMFPDAPDDARVWDGIVTRLEIRDLVWVMADLRRRAHDRGGNSGSSAAGLSRGYVAAG